MSTGITNSNAESDSGGLVLIDTVTLTTGYSSNGRSLMSTYFPSYAANNALWAIIAKNNKSQEINAFYYAAGSVVNVNKAVGQVLRKNGLDDGNYSLSISAGTTLELWSIDFDDLL